LRGDTVKRELSLNDSLGVNEPKSQSHYSRPYQSYQQKHRACGTLRSHGLHYVHMDYTMLFIYHIARSHTI